MFYDLTKIKALLAYHFCYPLPFAFLRSEAFLEQFMFGFTVHSDKKYYEQKLNHLIKVSGVNLEISMEARSCQLWKNYL